MLSGGREGNLQEGVMIGRERKTERKTRMTLGLRRFFWEGRTRERDIGGGGGGGGCAGSAAEDLFSPIG